MGIQDTGGMLLADEECFKYRRRDCGLPLSLERSKEAWKRF